MSKATKGPEAPRNHSGGRRLVAGSLLTILAAGGGFAAGRYTSLLGGNQQPRLTAEGVSTAAQNLARQCLDLTANGVTTQSGKEGSTTTHRRFAGNVACTVVERGTTVTAIDIHAPAPKGNAAGATDISFRYSPAKTGARPSPSSWEFSQLTAPGKSDKSGKLTLGYATRTDGFAGGLSGSAGDLKADLRITPTATTMPAAVTGDPAIQVLDGVTAHGQQILTEVY